MDLLKGTLGLKKLVRGLLSFALGFHREMSQHEACLRRSGEQRCSRRRSPWTVRGRSIAALRTREVRRPSRRPLAR